MSHAVFSAILRSVSLVLGLFCGMTVAVAIRGRGLNSRQRGILFPVFSVLTFFFFYMATL